MIIRLSIRLSIRIVAVNLSSVAIFTIMDSGQQTVSNLIFFLKLSDDILFLLVFVFQSFEDIEFRTDPRSVFSCDHNGILTTAKFVSDEGVSE
jgi:hypothetical protein